MVTIGLWIAFLTGLTITVIGVLYLVRPLMTAASFGLKLPPPAESTPWLRIKGVRDVAAGVVSGVLLMTAHSDVVGWAMLGFAIIPTGDAITVILSRGSVASAIGIHGATAAIMIIGSGFLLMG